MRLTKFSLRHIEVVAELNFGGMDCLRDKSVMQFPTSLGDHINQLQVGYNCIDHVEHRCIEMHSEKEKFL